MTRTIRILAMAAALLAGAAALAAIAIVLWPRGGEVAISPSAVALSNSVVTSTTKTTGLPAARASSSSSSHPS